MSAPVAVVVVASIVGGLLALGVVGGILYGRRRLRQKKRSQQVSSWKNTQSDSNNARNQTFRWPMCLSGRRQANVLHRPMKYNPYVAIQKLSGVGSLDTLSTNATLLNGSNLGARYRTDLQTVRSGSTAPEPGRPYWKYSYPSNSVRSVILETINERNTPGRNQPSKATNPPSSALTDDMDRLHLKPRPLFHRRSRSFSAGNIDRLSSVVDHDPVPVRDSWMEARLPSIGTMKRSMSLHHQASGDVPMQSLPSPPRLPRWTSVKMRKGINLQSPERKSTESHTTAGTSIIEGEAPERRSRGMSGGSLQIQPFTIKKRDALLFEDDCDVEWENIKHSSMLPNGNQYSGRISSAIENTSSAVLLSPAKYNIPQGRSPKQLMPKTMLQSSNQHSKLDIYKQSAFLDRAKAETSTERFEASLLDISGRLPKALQETTGNRCITEPKSRPLSSVSSDGEWVFKQDLSVGRPSSVQKPRADGHKRSSLQRIVIPSRPTSSFSILEDSNDTQPSSGPSAPAMYLNKNRASVRASSNAGHTSLTTADASNENTRQRDTLYSPTMSIYNVYRPEDALPDVIIDPATPSKQPQNLRTKPFTRPISTESITYPPSWPLPMPAVANQPAQEYGNDYPTLSNQSSPLNTDHFPQPPKYPLSLRTTTNRALRSKFSNNIKGPRAQPAARRSPIRRSQNHAQSRSPLRQVQDINAKARVSRSPTSLAQNVAQQLRRHNSDNSIMDPFVKSHFLNLGSSNMFLRSATNSIAGSRKENTESDTEEDLAQRGSPTRLSARKRSRIGTQGGMNEDELSPLGKELMKMARRRSPNRSPTRLAALRMPYDPQNSPGRIWEKEIF